MRWQIKKRLKDNHFSLKSKKMEAYVCKLEADKLPMIAMEAQRQAQENEEQAKKGNGRS